MPDNTLNNKRIAKNTLFLYLRMMFAVVVNLYASRLLLDKLGVEDYGVYNIVGGVVALMMFVNSAMQGATSRFITFALGKNNMDRLKETVNAAVHIHAFIFILLLVVGETVGLWFVNTQLNIPEDKYEAMNWVYQFSLLVSGLTILRVPFSALIISYERMDIYAYIEIFDVIARCAILFLLPLFFDRLIAYSALLLIVAVIVFLCYFVYCSRKVEGFNISVRTNKQVAKPIVSFAMWSLYGNGTYAISQQGKNILINNFFGVILNAASGVATQAGSVISTFVANVQNAFNPQIIKEYSVGNITRMQSLMNREIEIMLFLASLIFTPLFLNMDYIMTIWLKTVPDYAVIFCQIILLSNLVQIITNVFAIAIQATGRNKLFSFLVGTINFAELFVLWVCFSVGLDAYFAYITTLCAFIVKTIVEMILLHKHVPSIQMSKIVINILKLIALLAISFTIILFVERLIENSLVAFAVGLILNTLILSVVFAVSYPQYRDEAFKLITKYKNRVR